MDATFATPRVPGPPPENTYTPGEKHIPRFVTYTSPVSIAPKDGGTIRASTLPLNLILHIVSFLDDIGDISRVTRTSRLLYYMTLPQLYTRVSLHSYPEIRYVNGRPEGFGSGSPFIMALNGLVTKPHANVVQEFRMWGHWNEPGVDDFSKGRVPDNSMMLNILLRAVMDRMTKLQSFSWELDCKPLKTLYQGLGAHNTLTSLTIRFPNSRIPRPSVLIPPMANLRAFKALDIDPLCYPDDMSVMLLQSKKLEDLRIHFSPRMRQEAESSLSLGTYFGRCFSAGYKLPVKHFAMQNFYGPNSPNVSNVIDHDVCTSICFLDMFGGVGGSSMNVFLDDTWKDVPANIFTNFKRARANEQAEQHVKLISGASGLERFYMVNSRQTKTGITPNSASVPATPGKSPPDQEPLALGKQYIYALTRHHGSTLNHLLLSDQWILDDEDVSDLARYCPNVEQLGLAMSGSNNCTLRLLLPFFPKLQALRLFNCEFTDEILRHLKNTQQIANDLEKVEATQFRLLGLGDRVFRASKIVQDPSGVWRWGVKEVTQDDVRHVEIWDLDCLDIGRDPIAPFSP